MENSAVEWLEQQIEDTFYVAEASEMAKRFKGIFKQAKEMERKQRQKDFKAGNDSACMDHENIEDYFKQYIKSE